MASIDLLRTRRFRERPHRRRRHRRLRRRRRLRCRRRRRCRDCPPRKVPPADRSGVSWNLPVTTVSGIGSRYFVTMCHGGSLTRNRCRHEHLGVHREKIPGKRIPLGSILDGDRSDRSCVRIIKFCRVSGVSCSHARTVN